jgi:hypothetical protein
MAKTKSLIIEINVYIPNVTARKLLDRDGFNFEITDVHIVGLDMKGLIVAGNYGDEIYFSVVPVPVYYVWACQGIPGLEKYHKSLPEPNVVAASNIYWAKDYKDVF